MLIIGLVFLVAAPGEAAGAGGTIYYTGPWEGDTQGGTAVMTAMNSDGNGKTRLGIGMFGNPSTVLYNKQLWFIYTYLFPDQYYPDGITRRREVFALRADFDRDLNNNANTVVQLTDDPTLQARVSSTDWVPGGTDISFEGRRWSSAEPGATVVAGGIYRASLVFGADGNIVGLAEQPATPAIPFPLVETTPGDPWPALADTFCWDPTGRLVAYENATGNELWLADLHNTHTRIHIGPARRPQWSPDASLTDGDGNIIAFNPVGVGVGPAAVPGNTILGNSIFSNDGLGIDLGRDGITLNDALDADVGDNNFQNFPGINAKNSFLNPALAQVSGSLDSKPSQQYLIQVFSSALADPSGYKSRNQAETGDLSSRPGVPGPPCDCPKPAARQAFRPGRG